MVGWLKVQAGPFRQWGQKLHSVGAPPALALCWLGFVSANQEKEGLQCKEKAEKDITFKIKQKK